MTSPKRSKHGWSTDIRQKKTASSHVNAKNIAFIFKAKPTASNFWTMVMFLCHLAWKGMSFPRHFTITQRRSFATKSVTWRHSRPRFAHAKESCRQSSESRVVPDNCSDCLMDEGFGPPFHLPSFANLSRCAKFRLFKQLQNGSKFVTFLKVMDMPIAPQPSRTPATASMTMTSGSTSH